MKHLDFIFSVSGIDRSNKLQVLESPSNELSFGTFAFLILKQVRFLGFSLEFRKPEYVIVIFHTILQANLFQHIEAF